MVRVVRRRARGDGQVRHLRWILAAASIAATPTAVWADALATSQPPTYEPGISLDEAAGSVAEDAAPTTWVVVIGINKYPDTTPDLEVAEADATTVDRALAHLGVRSAQRLLVTGSEATSAGVKTAIQWLVDRARPRDLAVVFYAGHVVQRSPASQAILTADGQQTTDTDLADYLGELRANQAWYVIAGCYGGGFDELLGPGRVLTAASPADQPAYENLDLGHSYLVEYVFAQAIIQDRASRTIDDAYNWAQRRLAHDYPNRLLEQVGSDARLPDARDDGRA